jgi:hypothetical protein
MDDFINELKQKNKDFSEEYINMMKQYYQKLMNNPAELQNTLNNLKNGQNGIDPEGGITITPEPYCCVKVQDETGQKIFLNLCGSDKIDPPKEQHILEMNNQEGIRIPLSLSEKYEDFDVHGTACEVYDIIMNPSTLQKTENQPLVMGFILNLIASRLKERFKKVILIDKYVRLKNLKYKGKTVRSQRIRARKVKIDEIIDNSNEKEKNLKKNQGEGGVGTDQGMGSRTNIANEINKEVNEKGKTPNWNFVIINVEKTSDINGALFKQIESEAKNKILNNNGNINFDMLVNEEKNKLFKYFNGFNASPKYGIGILLLIEMELLVKSSGIRLNLSDESLTMYVPKLYSLEMNLPYKVNSKSANSFFNLESRILYIYLPFYEKDIEDFKILEENERIKNEKEKKEGQIGSSDIGEKIKLNEDYLYDVIN